MSRHGAYKSWGIIPFNLRIIIYEKIQKESQRKKFVKYSLVASIRYIRSKAKCAFTECIIIPHSRTSFQGPIRSLHSLQWTSRGGWQVLEKLIGAFNSRAILARHCNFYFIFLLLLVVVLLLILSLLILSELFGIPIEPSRCNASIFKLTLGANVTY